MSYTGGVILGILAVGILVLAVTQISEYVRRHTILTPRHFALRLVMAGLLLAVIAGIYAGAVLSQKGPWLGPVGQIVYWMGLLLVACVIVALALQDLQMLEKMKHQQRAELFRRLADLEESLREPKDSGN